MAEKVSGLIALGTIAILLCIFIPAASYTIYRTLGRKLRGRYRRLDLAAALVTITTFAAMLYIMIDGQQLYPRCGTYGGDPQMLLCLTDRYDDTGPAVEVLPDQAAVLMRSDLLVDIAACVIVPSALGIAVVLVLTRVISGNQTRRTPNNT